MSQSDLHEDEHSAPPRAPFDTVLAAFREGF
jgi:hypothetical protein